MQRKNRARIKKLNDTSIQTRVYGNKNLTNIHLIKLSLIQSVFAFVIFRCSAKSVYGVVTFPNKFYYSLTTVQTTER